MKKFYDFIPVTSALGFNSYYICANTPDGAEILRYNKNTGALQQFNQYEKAILFDGEITNSGFAIAGTIEGVGQGNQMFLQSYDSLLKLKWTYLYNYTNGNYNDTASQMKVSGNNIYIAGTSSGAVGDFGMLLKINETGNLLWARRLISGANLNTLKSLAVDAGADQAYVLTEQQRVIKYNSNGVQAFNRLIPLPVPSLGGNYNYITTDGRPGQMASKVILGGTNSYKKYYHPPIRIGTTFGIRV
ncbi:MAG: hypothetical protein IPO27_09605 [Bacteroidetes bacterium]|nr:hypothetical protein [Bacteroidota bacterium]